MNEYNLKLDMGMEWRGVGHKAARSKNKKKPCITYVFHPVLYGAHQPLEMLA